MGLGGCTLNLVGWDEMGGLKNRVPCCSGGRIGEHFKLGFLMDGITWVYLEPCEMGCSQVPRQHSELGNLTRSDGMGGLKNREPCCSRERIGEHSQ